jgi:ADP-heptose:LPS heptosyltransferase
MRPDHLGDLLFMTPALHALRQTLPSAHVACLVGPWAQTILRDNPDVDDLLACDFPWFNRRAKTSLWEPYAVLWREARLLRRAAFDVAVIMRFDFWWGATLARLAGIPCRIGYAVPDVAPFLTHAVPYQPGLHEAEQNIRLAQAAAAVQTPGVWETPGVWKPSDLALRFTIHPDDAAWADRTVGSPKRPDPRSESRDPLFAIHPGAGAAVKLWHADGWATVAKELAKQHKATIILTGSQAEAPLARAIAQRLDTPHIVLTGQTTLGQLAALFVRCRLVLGADSGPLHLAVAVGTPTVHLFGPIDPAIFGPWGDRARHVVVQARFFDQPCRNRPCNRLDYGPAELPLHACMQTITVDDVLTAARSLFPDPKGLGDL